MRLDESCLARERCEQGWRVWWRLTVENLGGLSCDSPARQTPCFIRMAAPVPLRLGVARVARQTHPTAFGLDDEPRRSLHGGGLDCGAGRIGLGSDQPHQCRRDRLCGLNLQHPLQRRLCQCRLAGDQVVIGR